MTKVLVLVSRPEVQDLKKVLTTTLAETILRIGPMHIADVTKGQENLSEVLVNCKSC